MTEADWPTGTDFAAHVRFATGRLSPRRQRLLAAAFCRAASHLYDHPELTRALDAVEWYADGKDTAAELEKARQACRLVAQAEWESHVRQVDAGAGGHVACIGSEVAWAVAFAATTPLPLLEVGNRVATAIVQARTGASLLAAVASVFTAFTAAAAEQSLAMRSVVWEVAGNPFRPAAFNPAWRTSTAVALAAQMYESREFSAMPILADALQDAGCDSEDVLDHCRDAHASHVRGCWVVDLVLGKE
jgi:hypothetical protein